MYSEMQLSNLIHLMGKDNMSNQQMEEKREIEKERNVSKRLELEERKLKLKEEKHALRREKKRNRKREGEEIDSFSSD